MADEEAVAAVRADDTRELSEAEWRKTMHEFVGRLDRWCERCNWPDRAAIHDVRRPEQAAAPQLGAEHMPHEFVGDLPLNVCDFCGRHNGHDIHKVGAEIPAGQPIEVVHKVLIGTEYIRALEDAGLVPKDVTRAVHVFAKVGHVVRLRYEVFADERLLPTVEAMREPAEGEQPGVAH